MEVFMKTVFVVVRDYDVEGYGIIGIFENRKDADLALAKNDKEGYGIKGSNRVEEIKLNTYFDINEINL
jgi:hypothetical protein